MGIGIAGNVAAYSKTAADARFLKLTNGNVGIGVATPIALVDTAQTWNFPSVAVTGASGTGTVATITFATQSAVIPVGATIVVASISPAGYNGTYVVTASTLTSVSYTNATTTTYVSGGTIQRLFTAIKTNITDTASNASSLLMDLQVGGTSKFRIYPTDAINSINGFRWGGATNGGDFLINASGNTFSIASNGNHDVALASNYFTVIRASGGIRIGSAVNSPRLFYDNDSILAQRNGTNAQTFRLYNTYSTTGGINYERLALISTAGDSFTIGTEATGTGVVRNLNFSTGGNARMTISSSGNVGIGITTPASKLTVTGGDVEITDTTKGVILKSPNGTRYRITIDDTGTLITTAI